MTCVWSHKIEEMNLQPLQAIPLQNYEINEGSGKVKTIVYNEKNQHLRSTNLKEELTLKKLHMYINYHSVKNAEHKKQKKFSHFQKERNS